MTGPLAGYRVCDLSGQLAGAGATKVLAAFGAEVIRVEDPVRKGRWDILRSAGPYREGQRGVDAGGAFNNHNVGKLGITLNLRDERGRDLLRRLIEQSDVVCSNFSAGVLDRLGFSYDEVRKLRPDVVYVTSSGFGETGPDRGHRVWGPIVQAVGGLSFEVGLPGREPAAWGYSLMDHVAAHALTMAILAALFERARTGEAQAIDLASTEVALSLLGPALADVAVNGRPRRRPDSPNGNRSEFVGMAPHGVHPSLGDDEWVAIACRDDGDWRALADVVEPWAADARWDHVADRRAHEDELDLLLDEWTRQREAGATVGLLRAAGVPASVVARPQERIEADPDTRDVGLWPEVDHPVIGRIAVDGLPFHLTEDDWSITEPAPCIGQHTDQVLRDLLGLDAAEIDGLRAEGVV